MALIPIWATTLMVQNETVYINIYVKLKNIFSNLNRYFAVLKHYVYILCIYIIYIYVLYYVIYYIMYHVMYYIMLCYMYYIYIYIYQDFHWGIGGNSPTSQKFAHSPRT